jgi:hypothetical protein
MADLFDIAIGVLVAVFIISIITLTMLAYGEELPCLVFNDGKIAIIESQKMKGDDSFGVYTYACEGHGKTIVWFLEHGYNITTFGEYEVLMTR